MENGKKAAIGATLLLLGVVGARIGMIYRERHAPEKPIVKTSTYQTDDDDLVFLKHKRQSSLADAKELIGSTLWVSAGGQMDYFRDTGHRADFSKKEGTLIGVDPLVIKEVFEQASSKVTTFRVPGGEKQVFLGFTLPNSTSPKTIYAVPVGYKESGTYSFLIDEIFFYDDPHQLYKHWGPEVWKAVDEHRVIIGMNERQVDLALGQVSKSLSNDYGNRMVVFSNMGKPFAVTFVHNKVTAFRPDQGF